VAKGMALARLAKRFLLWTGLGLGVILAAALLGLGLLRFKPDLFVPILERSLTPPGGRVSIARLSFRFRPLSLALEEVTTDAPAGAGFSLNLGSLRLEASLLGGLGGGPWLRRLEVTRPNLELAVRQKEGRPADLSWLAWLLAIERLTIEDGRLGLTRTQGRLEIKDLALTMRAAPDGNGPVRLSGWIRLLDPQGGPRLSGLVRGRGRLNARVVMAAEIEMVDGRIDLPRLAGPLIGRARFQLKPDRLLLESLSASLTPARLNLGPGLTLERPLSFDLAGQMGLDSGRVELEKLDLEAEDLGRLAGRLSGSTAGFEASLAGRLESLEAAWADLTPILPPALAQGRVQGQLPFTLSLKASPAGQEGRLQLNLAGIGLSWPEWGLAGRLSGGFSLAGRPDRGPLSLAAALELRPEPLAQAGGPEPRPTWAGLLGRGPLRLALAGRLGLAPVEVDLTGLDLQAEGLGRVQGQLAGPWGGPFRGSLKGRLADLAGLWTGLKPILPSDLDRAQLAGELPFNLNLASGPAGQEGGLELTLAGVELGWPGLSLKARLSGTAGLAGPLRGPLQATGRLRLEGGLAPAPLTLSSAWTELDLTGRLPGPLTAGCRFGLAEDQVSLSGRPLPLGRVEGAASLTLDPAGALSVKDLKLSSSTLGRLGASLNLAGQGLSGLIKGQDLDLASAARLLQAATGLPLTGWSPAGRLGLETRLQPGPAGLQVETDLSLTRAGLASPDGKIMAERAGGGLRLALARPWGRPVRAELDLTQGQVLLNTVFLDLTQTPFRAKVAAAEASAGGLAGLDLTAELGGHGRIGLKGDLRRKDGAWDYEAHLTSPELDLGRLYQTFVRDPLAASRPDLSGLNLSGRAELDLDLAGRDKGLEVKGRLGLKDGRLEREQAGLLVEGLNLDLPLRYRLDPGPAGPAAGTKPDRWGHLRLARLSLPGGELADLDLPVAVVPNRLLVGREVAVSLFGASLNLSDVRVENPFSAGFEVLMEAELKNLDLGRISPGGIPLQGRLEGRLGRVRLSRERLEAPGALKGRLFDGQLTATNLAVQRPFSPGRLVAADLKMDKMDLKKLSKALQVGRITGRVSAEVSGLRLAYGQAVAFGMQVLSVPVKGVDQRVSLKAVNSISVLGTGASLTGLGVKLISPFFQEFPYDKIGFACTLRNDVFTVKGLIREDGVEYLVKKPFLTGINVINRNPDNRISFSDMLERLRRVIGGAGEPEESS